MIDEGRLSALEEKVRQLDADIEEIKKKQDDAIDKQHAIELDSRDLKAELRRLIDLLSAHQTWHDRNDEKKYKVTDIILAVGMLLLTALQFLPIGGK